MNSFFSTKFPQVVLHAVVTILSVAMIGTVQSVNLKKNASLDSLLFFWFRRAKKEVNFCTHGVKVYAVCAMKILPVHGRLIVDSPVAILVGECIHSASTPICNDLRIVVR
jgi:hypothetical protein